MYEILKEYLAGNGYQLIQFSNDHKDVNSNQSLGYLINNRVGFLTKVVNGTLYVVTLTDYLSGADFDKEQYDILVRQVKQFFFDKGYSQVKLLHVIITEDTNAARELFGLIDTYWIIDEKELRLLIYENQSSEFADVRGLIENVLSGKSRPKVKYFTVMNTVIVAINVIVFVYYEWILSALNSEKLIAAGSLFWPYVSQRHEYYRIFTYMFIHFGISHLSNNMIVLICIGNYLERALGSGKYTLLYLGSGLIAGLSSLSYNMINGNMVYSAGASGAVFGIVGAMLFLVIRNRGSFEDIGARQMVLFLFLSLYSGVTSQGVDNVAHIGGILAGFLLAFLLYRRKKGNVSKV